VAGEVSEPMQALYEGDRERGERLLAERGEIDVFEAAAFGRDERLRELLDADEGLAHAESPDGFTALHFAAFFRQPEAARLLLERGADATVAARNPMRVEPLHSAAAADQTEIARMLLDAGADPSIHDDKYDATVLGWAEYCAQPAVAQLLRERGVSE
jgi:ankyrin repeat protein